MPSVFVVPCPALPARCSVRFSRFRPGHLDPARLPSGARAPSSGEEVIYPHAGGLSREEGDFSGKIFAGGGGRAAPGAREGPLSWENPGGGCCAKQDRLHDL